MTHDIESTFDAWQKFLAVGAAVGSIGLALQNILDSVGVRGPVFLVVALTGLCGWLLFAGAVLKIRSLGKTKDGRTYMEQIRGDERLDTVRARAFQAGFFAILLMQVIGIILNVTVPGMFDIADLASTSIALGVAVSVVMFHRISDR